MALLARAPPELARCAALAGLPVSYLHPLLVRYMHLIKRVAGGWRFGRCRNTHFMHWADIAHRCCAGDRHPA